MNTNEQPPQNNIENESKKNTFNNMEGLYKNDHEEYKKIRDERVETYCNTLEDPTKRQEARGYFASVNSLEKAFERLGK